MVYVASQVTCEGSTERCFTCAGWSVEKITAAIGDAAIGKELFSRGSERTTESTHGTGDYSRLIAVVVLGVPHDVQFDALFHVNRVELTHGFADGLPLASTVLK